MLRMYARTTTSMSAASSTFRSCLILGRRAFAIASAEMMAVDSPLKYVSRISLVSSLGVNRAPCHLTPRKRERSLPLPPLIFSSFAFGTRSA